MFADVVNKLSKDSLALDAYADIGLFVGQVTQQQTLVLFSLSFSIGYKTGGYIDMMFGDKIDAYVGDYANTVGDYYLEKTGSVEIAAALSGLTRAFGALAWWESSVGSLGPEAAKQVAEWINEQKLLDPAFKFYDEVTGGEFDPLADMNDGYHGWLEDKLREQMFSEEQAEEAAEEIHEEYGTAE
jgi:hypothetical protein